MSTVLAFGPERCMWESDCGGPVQMKDPGGDCEASVRLIRDRADLLRPRQGTDPRWHSVQLPV